MVDQEKVKRVLDLQRQLHAIEQGLGLWTFLETVGATEKIPALIALLTQYHELAKTMTTEEWQALPDIADTQ